ncbi:hypothetical protein BHE16_09685 [Neomicrococcus aestuarii]|uniref:Uncharacterized protein n=1 Tax=Neomicrococcus aestuarii TaxID=556325 RepID=A0A1L2ZPU9_9MICC|nr:hypothetical protein BHE16_09685 [Neomicrococcus aestuarii]
MAAQWGGRRWTEGRFHRLQATSKGVANTQVIALLVAGGVTTMEYATLIFAIPVTIVAYLVMASFSKVLRMERAEQEGRAQRRRTVSAVGGNEP